MHVHDRGLIKLLQGWHMHNDIAQGSTVALSAPTREPRHKGWLIAGCACLVIGTAGIVLPLVPTVDFYGMAAFCFARGSLRWESWLLKHPHIGPIVHRWRTDRSVPLWAKCSATLSMSVSCTVVALRGSHVVAAIMAVVCSSVLAYLWTRPAPISST
jgi:uncharacterized membrane protein YbaN (DUF454 family)